MPNKPPHEKAPRRVGTSAFVAVGRDGSPLRPCLGPARRDVRPLGTKVNDALALHVQRVRQAGAERERLEQQTVKRVETGRLVPPPCAELMLWREEERIETNDDANDAPEEVDDTVARILEDVATLAEGDAAEDALWRALLAHRPASPRALLETLQLEAAFLQHVYMYERTGCPPVAEAREAELAEGAPDPEEEPRAGKGKTPAEFHAFAAPSPPPPPPAAERTPEEEADAVLDELVDRATEANDCARAVLSEVFAEALQPWEDAEELLLQMADSAVERHVERMTRTLDELTSRLGAVRLAVPHDELDKLASVLAEAHRSRAEALRALGGARRR